MSSGLNEIVCVYEAGQRLNVIRATICKALRSGAAPSELDALLKAEEMAMSELAQVMAR